MDDVIRSLRERDFDGLRAAVATDARTACAARTVVEAARLAWTRALALLLIRGADLNAAWRGYRPLHALIQEEPHKDREPPTAARLACLKWLLAHGANPDALGAFPPSRALLTAAFVGESANSAPRARLSTCSFTPRSAIPAASRPASPATPAWRRHATMGG